MLRRQQLPQTYWQTGHIDVIRTSTVLELKSLSGKVILPYMVDPAFTVDIDSPERLEPGRMAGLAFQPGYGLPRESSPPASRKSAPGGDGF